MSQVLTRRAIHLTIVSLLLVANNTEVCGQRIDIEEAAVRRARVYEPVIVEAASRHGVDASILWVIAYLETRFNPILASRKGARGMMQFMPDTARKFGLSDPHDPVRAIDAAASYVHDLAKRFNRVDLVLAAYNAGETAVEAYLTGRPIKVGRQVINPKGLKTGGIPPYRETLAYVANGLRLFENLRQTKPFLARQQQASSEDSISDQGVASSGRIVRKSIRSGSPSDERQSSRRTIYFVSVKDDR